MTNDSGNGLEVALARIPRGLFVLTAGHDGRKGAVLARSVQLCSRQPPMLIVAIGKGRSVEPLIQESRHFAVCQVRSDDRLLIRRFTRDSDPADDALASLITTTEPNGTPVIARALSYLECEVVKHMELDCDHRIYVGEVYAGDLLNAGAPAVCFGVEAYDAGSADHFKNGLFL